jgi:hypothetical protein
VRRRPRLIAKHIASSFFLSASSRWHGKSATGSAEGVVEFGLLLGLFIVSPQTLTGAFQILQAVVGAL